MKGTGWDGLRKSIQSNIIKHIQELPFSGFEDLAKLAELVHDKFDPYRGHFGRASEFQNVAAAEPPARPSGATSGPSIIPPPNPSGARPVVSDRVKWKNPPSFDAEPFLSDPLVRAAFVDPEVLRKDPSEWPPKQTPKVNCSKSELLKLASRWDELGACMLLPLEQKNFKEAVGLFCVGKDAQYDRLIINPVTINSRMHSISKSTKELAPGCMLGLLHLEDDMMFRFQADDLTDFYYTILVSESRATRNAIRQVFHSHQVSHFRSYKPEFDGKPLLICLRTLAMGDNLAVEIAQQAHRMCCVSCAGRCFHTKPSGIVVLSLLWRRFELRQLTLQVHRNICCSLRNLGYIVHKFIVTSFTKWLVIT